MSSRRFFARTALVLALLLAVAFSVGPVRAADLPAAQIDPAPALMTPVQPSAELPVFLTGFTYACCLDDWQPGNCPVGTRVFATCGPGCDNCGPFSCVPASTHCFK